MIITKLTQFIVLCLLLVLMGCSPNYVLFPNLTAYDDKRAIELLTIGGALIWGLLGGLENSKQFAIPGLSWRIGVSSFSILVLMSCLTAASPKHAFLEVSVFAGLFFLSALVSTAWPEYRFKGLYLMISIISLGAAIYMIGFYVGYLASFLEEIPLVWPDPFFMFSNIRQFNQYQLWTLGLLCLPLLSGSVKNNYKLWALGLLVAWWVLLFASTSRGVLLAWLLSMLTTWWYYRRLARPFLQLQMKCFCFGFLVYELLFVWLPKLNSGGGSVVVVPTVLRGDTNDRIYLWTHAWHMIQAHPWLGVGPMHFAWYPNSMAAHPHNSVVQLACEWGLPATGLILVLAGYGMYRWLRRFNTNTLKAVPESEQVLAVALFFTAVASAFYSLVDGVIVMPLSQVMMAVVLGLMIGLYRQSDPSAPVKPLNDITHRVFAGVILVVMVWSVLPELLPNILGNFEMIPMGYQVIGPRFWQEGGIPHQ